MPRTRHIGLLPAFQTSPFLFVGPPEPIEIYRVVRAGLIDNPTWHLKNELIRNMGCLWWMRIVST